MIEPWGHPWGVVTGVKTPKMGAYMTIHKNGQKIMKKNEKVLDFSLEISKTIFHPTHPVRKK